MDPKKTISVNRIKCRSCFKQSVVAKYMMICRIAALPHQYYKNEDSLPNSCELTGSKYKFKHFNLIVSFLVSLGYEHIGKVPSLERIQGPETRLVYQ